MINLSSELYEGKAAAALHADPSSENWGASFKASELNSACVRKDFMEANRIIDWSIYATSAASPVEAFLKKHGDFRVNLHNFMRVAFS